MFDKDDVGEAYCEMLISKGKSEPLIDLPSDAQLPSFYDRRLFERYSLIILLHCQRIVSSLVFGQSPEILPCLQCLHRHDQCHGRNDFVRGRNNFGHPRLYEADLES